jgi:CHAT domain-containing protein
VVRSAFGEGTPWKLRRLQYSRREVQRIARLYPQEDILLHLGEAATEENVKTEGRLSHYRFIHFAAHGLLNENKPQYSGIVLTLPQKEDPRPKTQDPRPTDPAAPASSLHEQTTKDKGQGTRDTAEDGLLQVYEIFNLKLNADMVVLSACETGLGKEVKGEGLIGLTRAFLYAGTPSVVVSLWKVEDRSTAELMTQFYRHLKDGQRSKAAALRQAQLELIRTGVHPYFWAPFVLVGQP